jgi:hypothetical protein
LRFCTDLGGGADAIFFFLTATEKVGMPLTNMLHEKLVEKHATRAGLASLVFPGKCTLSGN